MATDVQPRARGLAERLSDSVVGLADNLLKNLAVLGSFASFAWTVLRYVPSTLAMYPKEMLRQLKDIAWGSGAVLVGGGTVGVMILLSLAAGT